ncbi:MAG: methylmalonyl-CoA mutase, N-terminal domain, partial [Blastocatellia bacterium]
MSTVDIANRLQEAEQEWEERTLKPTLKQKPESKSEFTTTSLAPVERLYTPNSISDFDYETELGFPGQPPYTRGIHATGYRGRLWTMRQFAGFGSAFDTNQR